MILKENEILDLERIKRLNLINSITGIKPANLIGTISSAGMSNLAIFGSTLHIGSNPPLLGILVRPVEEIRRDTYRNIMANACFTINHVPVGRVQHAHNTSAKFEQWESEFIECGFTEEFIGDFPAPFVGESRIKAGLSLQEELEIRSNGTVLLIGRIIMLSLPDDFISEEGYVDLELAGSAGLSGLNTYYSLTKLDTFPYVNREDVKEQT